MVIVAQLVRASDCGSEGRRFEPGQSPRPGIYFRAFFMEFSLPWRNFFTPCLC